jgi:hypothetical protein
MVKHTTYKNGDFGDGLLLYIIVLPILPFIWVINKKLGLK